MRFHHSDYANVADATGPDVPLLSVIRRSLIHLVLNFMRPINTFMRHVIAFDVKYK